MSADTQTVKPLDLDKLEELVNEKIRAATPVIVTVYEEGDTQLEKVSNNTGKARYPKLLISLEL
jgi:hypothetical protein